jgi:protocatechuate 3,4-dioxygenase beta subunit
MESACSYFHIVRLQHHASLLRPIALQGKNQTLEGRYIQIWHTNAQGHFPYLLKFYSIAVAFASWPIIRSIWPNDRADGYSNFS